MFAKNGSKYKPMGVGSGNRRAVPDFSAGLAEALAQLEAKTGAGTESQSQKWLSMVDLPKLHPAQQKMIAEARRYNVAVCGRRFGKTFMSAEVLLNGRNKKGAVHGFPVAFYAPTYQTMLETWRTFCTLLKPLIQKKSEQDKRIDLITGGVVEFWSLDNPDAGRGRKYSVICVDEAAMIKRLEEAVTQNIMPLLLDYQGEAWFVSTPKGRNYFETLFQRGNPANPAQEDDWMSWQLPTWENPYISKDDVEKMRQTMPRLAFLQEIEAQFLSFAGTFVKAEHIQVGSPPSNLKLYQGVDLAISMKENADYTAIVTVGVDDETGKVWIVDAERRRVGFRGALEFIREKANRWRPVDIAVEVVQYQAAVVEELLRSTDLPVRKVRPDKDKLTRAQGLITRYENLLVWHSSALPIDFTNEILSFGPDCDHDDFMDAAVYAYMLTGDYGRARFLFPEGVESAADLARKAAERDMPGLPTGVVKMMDSLPPGQICGRCSSFNPETGMCMDREVLVLPRDQGCVLYVTKR